MTAESWPLLILGAVAAVAIVAFAWTRARRIGIALAIAVFALLASAADLRVARLRPPTLAVLIDASPSTRGFWFRDVAAVTALARRVAPDATLRFYTFADGAAEPLAGDIIERATPQTVLAAIDGDAVLLFSDGRFEGPASLGAPVFPAVRGDPITDARIAGVAEETGRLIVSVINDGGPRVLTFPDATMAAVPTGSSRIAYGGLRDGAIRLDPGDRWPENDFAVVGPPVRWASERWWIGDAPPPGFRAVDVAALPALDQWLAARVVVLNGLSSERLGTDAMRTLTRYVRDLGGALVIAGGPNAFSAGGYDGTPLDALSPLASAPPSPRQDWLVLVDASGSMSAPAADGRSRLDHAIDAASAVARTLPTTDRVAGASFARDLVAWPGRDARRVLPPAGLVAGGPTNLRASLESLARTRRSLPLRVVVLTDGEADLGDLATLGDALRAARLTLDWIALERPAAGPLATLAIETGGVAITAGEAIEWPATAARGIRAATKTPPLPGPIDVAWRGPLARLSETLATQINTTSLRDGATILAVRADDGTPVAARWNFGVGSVAAIAYASPTNIVEDVAAQLEQLPDDSRFAVTWLDDRVIVTASDAGQTMDALRIEMRRSRDDGDESFAVVKQTAPGRYEEAFEPMSHRTIATLTIAGRPIDARALPGLLAREFREIGIDREALEALARRTGGRMIDVSAENNAFPLARRAWPLGVPLLCVGIVALAAALLSGRRSV